MFIAIAMLALAPLAFAHCDWIKGPVVADAKTALSKGDITPVLKWIAPKDEAEVRSAFTRTLSARKIGGEARDIAEQWFFETVVRIHRASEGEPFTGLKGNEYTPSEGIEMADHAIESGSLDDVDKALRTALRERFTAAMDAMKHANDSVEAGRHFVHAYAEFVHYVDMVHRGVPEGHSEE
jgi:hypothetical protein